MLSTYRVKAVDLIDETDYLLGTAANREQLLGAITDIESEDNLVSLSLDARHSA